MSVTLSGATTSQPTFTAPSGLSQDETLSFTLVVSDGSLQSVPDGVNVTVSSGVVPPNYGPNIAPSSTASASSERPASGQPAAKAVDWGIDGYGGNPGDPTREWVTNGEHGGAWIQLTWPSNRTIAKVVLYDR